MELNAKAELGVAELGVKPTDFKFEICRLDPFVFLFPLLVMVIFTAVGKEVFSPGSLTARGLRDAGLSRTRGADGYVLFIFPTFGKKESTVFLTSSSHSIL